jgi:hypothetical protein
VRQVLPDRPDDRATGLQGPPAPDWRRSKGSTVSVTQADRTAPSLAYDAAGHATLTCTAEWRRRRR